MKTKPATKPAKKPSKRPAKGPAMQGPPRVTKGGDGGAAVPEAMLRRASFADKDANRRRVLTGGDVGRGLGRRERRAARAVFEAVLVETADPFDVAHGDRDPATGGLLYLAQGARGVARFGLAAHPRRRYHPSQTVATLEGAVVGVDSAFDAMHERAARLAAEGLTTQSVGAVRTSFLAAQLDARLTRGVRLRDVLHQETRCAMSPEEMRLEVAASAMLAQRRNGGGA